MLVHHIAKEKKLFFVKWIQMAGLPKNGFACIEGGGHIYQPLIGGTTKQQVGVVKLLDKRTVDKHVDILKQLTLFLMDETLESKTGIAPDIFVGKGMDKPGQLGKACGLIHGIAARECDIGIGVIDNDAQQL